MSAPVMQARWVYPLESFGVGLLYQNRGASKSLEVGSGVIGHKDYKLQAS